MSSLYWCLKSLLFLFFFLQDFLSKVIIVILLIRLFLCCELCVDVFWSLPVILVWCFLWVNVQFRHPPAWVGQYQGCNQVSSMGFQTLFQVKWLLQQTCLEQNHPHLKNMLQTTVCVLCRHTPFCHTLCEEAFLVWNFPFKRCQIHIHSLLGHG